MEFDGNARHDGVVEAGLGQWRRVCRRWLNRIAIVAPLFPGKLTDDLQVLRKANGRLRRKLERIILGNSGKRDERQPKRNCVAQLGVQPQQIRRA